jgi:hypothetical protein
LGKPQPGSRHYKREGTQEEVGHWYDVLSTAVGPTVSPGGVRMFVPVTRAAIHERIDRGRLSLFEFDVVTRRTNLFGMSKAVQERPYTFVPVSECRQWREEIEQRAIARGMKPEEITKAKPDWLENFVEAMNEEDSRAKKSKPATLQIPLSEYDLDLITRIAHDVKYDTPGEFIAACLRPVVRGGFSALSFAKAGWWMSNLFEKYDVGKVPMPKFIEKLRSRKS